MRIGIDISQLAFQGTGVAVYTENLVSNLLQIDKKNEYVLFYSSLRKQNQIFNGLRVKPGMTWTVKNYRFPPLLLEKLWNQVHILPIETFTGKLDLFHSSDWLEPPSRCPKVTTIHDLTVLKYPETFMTRGGHDIVANQKRKLYLVKKESRIIIAVSENTKRDIADLLGIPDNRIRVVYEAYNTEFTEKKKENTESIKKKYQIEGKYILAVGTREPRKNLERVIESYKILLDQYPDLSLVIAGKYGWGGNLEVRSEKWEAGKIKILGYVSRADLAILYAGSEVFVYPSLYEGFGLPVLEAMASGCPVVTSKISSLPEIVGGAGVLVDPLKSKNIAVGIDWALKNKEALIKKGLARAGEFSWEKTAKQTLAIYNDIISL